MKLNITCAFKHYCLYLDIIYFSSTKFLKYNKSVKMNKSELVKELTLSSPVIIGKYNNATIIFAINDIYKSCYKNNHRKSRLFKLSRKHLKSYVETHRIYIGGIEWLQQSVSAKK